jgi:hypothetical protein
MIVPMAIITLCTDFGIQDEYVGVIKGVILSVNPAVSIVDLSHSIPPQDVIGAAYLLRASYACFPKGSLHAVIVDPGVGTGRAIVAARCDGYLFLAPDNGLLPLVWGKRIPKELVEVENSDLFRKPVSRTFHGRDIFAPVAAYLAQAPELRRIGRSIDPSRLQRLKHHGPSLDPERGITGNIVAIDRFGNLITDIEASLLDRLASGSAFRQMAIRLGNHRIQGLTDRYADGAPGEAIALIGSRNCLEVAVNCGNAAETLHAARGDGVRVGTVL